MVEVLRPIDNLMCTSIKKTRILIRSDGKDPSRPDVQVEDTKVTVRLADGSKAEYPRDPTQPQNIHLFLPTGVRTIKIPPTREPKDIKDRADGRTAQVFPPTEMSGPGLGHVWIDDTNNTGHLFIPAINPFVGPVMIETPPSQPVGSRGQSMMVANQKRKGRAKKVPYGLKQKAISRSVKNPIVSKSEPSSPEESEPSTGSLVPSGSPTSEQRTVVSPKPKVNPDVLLQSSLNIYLIYFKTVEKKVLDTLDISSSQQLGEKSLTDLNSLKNELQPFLEKLERFWHEQEAVIAEIERSTEFQEILACVTTLHRIFEELDESEISQLLQMTSLNSQEHILCSILGLRDDVADSLKDLDPETRGHLTDEQWIQDFIDQNGKEIACFDDWETGFKSLGFTTVKSNVLAKLLEKNPFATHLTTTQWAEEHISHEFNHNILLAGHQKESSITTPYNTHGEYDREFNIRTEDGQNVKATDTWMHDKIPDLELFHDYLKQAQNSMQEAEFLFHGTDHKSALNIVCKGIDVESSKRGLDFSDGKGFYLSTDFEKAHEWPMRRALAKRRKASTAVLVFKASTELFQESDGKAFPDDCEEWRSVVTFFRSRKGQYESSASLSRQEKQRYRKLKYIFGPMSGDGLNVSISLTQNKENCTFV